MEDFAGYSKLGPREKGRKEKGKRKPQAVRSARSRRRAFLKTVESRVASRGSADS